MQSLARDNNYFHLAHLDLFPSFGLMPGTESAWGLSLS